MNENYLVVSTNEGQPWWLAEVEGDPGRTIVRENAKVFDSKSKAQSAIKRVIKRYPHRPSLVRLMVVKQTGGL